MLDMEILMKFAPASVATALASIVLPVPGGPNNRIPLHGCTISKSKLNQNEQYLNVHFEEQFMTDESK